MEVGMNFRGTGALAMAELTAEHGELEKLMETTCRVLSEPSESGQALRAIRLLSRLVAWHFEDEEAMVASDDVLLDVLRSAHLELSWLMDDLERSADDHALRLRRFSIFASELRMHEAQVDEPIFLRMAA
jgi:hypothetical protein